MDEIIGFYQWETADLQIEIEPASAMDGWTELAVSIKQYDAEVVRFFEAGAPEISGNAINLHLTQEETGKFQPTDKNSACDFENQVPRPKVQVNIKYGDERDTSTEGELDVYENLLKGVM